MTTLEKRRAVLLVRDGLQVAIAAAERAGVSAPELELIDDALECAWVVLSVEPLTTETNLAATRLLVAARDRLSQILAEIDAA